MEIRVKGFKLVAFSSLFEPSRSAGMEGEKTFCLRKIARAILRCAVA